jgi:tRNA (adenine57-N1/adenine58-N1)-methyltransferase
MMRQIYTLRKKNIKDTIEIKGQIVRTKFGCFRKEQFKNNLLDNNIYVWHAKLSEILKKFHRPTNTVSLSDFGYILQYTGLSDSDIVVDAGTGSGFLACYYSIFLRDGHVYSYERRSEFYEIAKKNLEFIKRKNVTLINDDISNTDIPFFDLLSLDLATPWKYFDLIERINVGGGVFIFSISFSDLVIIHQKLMQIDTLSDIITIEPLARKIRGTIEGPRSNSFLLGHPRFLTFARKIAR